MRILSVAWAIYDSRIEQFCGNCTGAGLVIKNLCEYIGKEHESYLYIGQYDIDDIKLGNINIIGNVLEDNVNKYKTRAERLTCQFERKVLEIKPDIVNIHGIGEIAIKCIYICKKHKIPCVFIEHLYIGTNKTFEKYDRDIEWERELYNIPDLNIVAVSTGMKKKILSDFNKINSNKIYVIKNGTDFTAEVIKSDLRKKYLIGDKKILLCVGNITQRKNQLQLIDAFELLPQYIQDKLSIIFCGIDRMNGSLEEKIKKEDLQNELIYVGAVDSNEMKKFYSIADGLVMPSLAEGLSIAALEALAYGLPIIMFANSECAEDLNDEHVSAFAKNRDSKSLAEAIDIWYNKKWNRRYIEKYSENFTIRRMADEYIELNKRIIGIK